MKIYNQNKTQIIENPDLSKGYLQNDTIVIGTIPAQAEVMQQSHIEVVKEYSNGGKIVKTIIDIPYQPAIPAQEQIENIQVYIPYTQNELNNIKINELKQKLEDTDYKAIKASEGQISSQEYEPIKLQRQAWRAEINLCEEEMNQLKANILNIYINEYYDETDSKDEWFEKIKQLTNRLGYAANMKDYKENPDDFKGNVTDISTVIRVALTSKAQTPDLYMLLKLIGKERILKRFNKFIK